MEVVVISAEVNQKTKSNWIQSTDAFHPSPTHLAFSLLLKGRSLISESLKVCVKGYFGSIHQI